jgi:hypothetical protein
MGWALVHILSIWAVGSIPTRPRGEDLYMTFPVETDPVIQIQVTPKQVVNMTVGEFSDISKKNRESYNQILDTLKYDNMTDVFDYNPLLKGGIGGLGGADGQLEKSPGEFWSWLPPTWATFLTGEYCCFIPA